MTNYDRSEVEKFSQNQDEWWDPQGPHKPLHALNPVRLQFIKDYAALTQKQALDVGCGGGLLAEAMAKAGAQVEGIDLNEQGIAAARGHAQGQDLSLAYHVASVEQWAERHEQHYDIVTCMELLEHVPDPQAFLGHCARMVKSGGWLFFSTLNRNLKTFLVAIVGAEYIANMLPKGTHHYHKLIKPSELAAWSTEAGLNVRSIKGLSYNPVTNGGSLKRKPSVDYIMALRA